jgi:hypothetical protein
MRKLVAALGFSALALALPSTANAATILDFGSALHGAAVGLSSLTIEQEVLGVNPRSSLLQSTLDDLTEGFLVTSPFLPEETEAGSGETLTVNFGLALFGQPISLRVLFGYLHDGEGIDSSDAGGAFVPFFANSDNGDLTPVIGEPEVDQIPFQASFVDDDAVDSPNLTAVPVPEPASMILLGTGLLFVARRCSQMKR